MFSWNFLFWLLQTLVPFSSFDAFQCNSKVQSHLYHDGNVVIAALVPLFNYAHKKSIDFTGDQITVIQ